MASRASGPPFESSPPAWVAVDTVEIAALRLSTSSVIASDAASASRESETSTGWVVVDLSVRVAPSMKSSITFDDRSTVSAPAPLPTVPDAACPRVRSSNAVI